ncbi:MAG: peptide deformylase [Bacteroidales bacterium]
MKKRVYLLILTIVITVSTQSCGIFNREVKTVQYSSSFNNNEITLIMEADTTTPLRVLKTTNLKDSIILRTKCDNITPNTKDPFLNTLIKRMYATVTDSASLGVGIAAPQVGVSKNIILVQRVDKEGEPFEAYINPRIIQWTDKKQECPEGCLSIPNIRGVTKTRAYAVLIEYYTPAGEKKSEMVEGYTAVIFQHETDHLNGILFIDHL